MDSTTSAGLATALSENMIAFWAVYGRAPGAFLHADPEVTWLYTGIRSPLFNGVVKIDTTPDGIRRVHEQLAERIAAGGAPAFWWASDRAQRSDVGKVLEGLGLEVAGEVPAMAIDLARLPAGVPVVAGLQIRRVSGPGQQRVWAAVAAEGTGFPEAAIEQMSTLEASLSDPEYLAQPRYIGYLDGVPVASSALVPAAGVAGLYAVATLPAARGRGIGNAMTLAAMLDARRRGYRVGVLQASSMGYPIYKKLGFADVYSYRLYLQP